MMPDLMAEGFPCSTALELLVESSPEDGQAWTPAEFPGIPPGAWNDSPHRSLCSLDFKHVILLNI